MAKEEDKGGGLISHLISNLVPSSPKLTTEEVAAGQGHSTSVSGDAEEEEEEEKGSAAAGVMSFNSIIPGILHDDHEAQKCNGDGTTTQGQEGGCRGGLIHNLVSHLPSAAAAPLPDDAAPATDEASILIHSIIHD